MADTQEQLIAEIAGSNKLIRALLKNDTLTALYYIYRRQWLEQTGQGGITPLMAAATHGNVMALKALLAAGVALNTQDKDGNTAFFHTMRNLYYTSTTGREQFWAPEVIAAQQKNILTCLRLLAQNGADVDVPNYKAERAFMYAAVIPSAEACRICLDFGADVRVIGDKEIEDLFCSPDREILFEEWDKEEKIRHETYARDFAAAKKAALKAQAARPSFSFLSSKIDGASAQLLKLAVFSALCALAGFSEKLKADTFPMAHDQPVSVASQKALFATNTFFMTKEKTR